jgi:hypothetical protein
MKHPILAAAIVLSTSLLAFAPTLAEDAQSTNAADSKTRPETVRFCGLFAGR